MKLTMMIAVFVFGLLGASLAFAQTAGCPCCAQNKDMKAGKGMMGRGPAAMDAAQPREAGNRICPVLGGPIKEGQEVKVEYKGKIYNLCCAGCVEKFNEDPEKFSAMAQEEAQGRKK